MKIELRFVFGSQDSAIFLFGFSLRVALHGVAGESHLLHDRGNGFMLDELDKVLLVIGCFHLI